MYYDASYRLTFKTFLTYLAKTPFLIDVCQKYSIMENVNTPLVLALIRAEMKNYKLIRGFEAAGALIENFYTGLDQRIFDLLAIEEDIREQLFDVYDEFMEQIKELSTDDFLEQLNDLSLKLLIQLLTEKKCRERIPALLNVQLKSNE